MRKKFRFKLEPVEKMRKQRELEALRNLAHAQKRFQEAVKHKAELMKMHNQALVRREMLGQDSFEQALSFQLESEFIMGTKQRMIQADQFILRTKRQVEKAMREYLQARRQSRAIEILRAKAFAEWKHDIHKSEQKELDDLYVMRARINKEQQVESSEEEVA